MSIDYQPPQTSRLIWVRTMCPLVLQNMWIFSKHCYRNIHLDLVVHKLKRMCSPWPLSVFLYVANISQINLGNCKGFFYSPHNYSLFDEIFLIQQRFSVSGDFIMHAPVIQNSHNHHGLYMSIYFDFYKWSSWCSTTLHSEPNQWLLTSCDS